MNFSLLDIFTVFMVLFAVIDIIGSIPVIIDLKQRSGKVQALKSTLIAYSIMLLFSFFGEPFLNLFGVDIRSFAIAGSFVLFFIGLEMVLGIEFFRYDISKNPSTIVPIAFPLIAGAGTMTTLISLKAEYQIMVIFVALTLNMVVVFIVLKATALVEKIIGTSGTQILKKVFGIILLAIAIRLFLSGTGIELGNAT